MNMAGHPYKNQPDYAFWNRSVTGVTDVDVVVQGQFEISKQDRIATAGSCFAQHISRFLLEEDYNYLITEPAHPILPAHLRETFSYGIYSARFGNVYTARQLLQLFERAYGQFVPIDEVWTNDQGQLVDPFRPGIQKDGFVDLREYRADREHHFASVRRMFEDADVFMFTLGLTECWMSSRDGAAFPLAPGVKGGTYNASDYVLKNFTVSEVIQDLRAFACKLRKVNHGCKVLLTVSPVPLMATAEDRHVVVATAYSKSVLRVAAERAVEDLDGFTTFLPTR